MLKMNQSAFRDYDVHCDLSDSDEVTSMIAVVLSRMFTLRGIS